MGIKIIVNVYNLPSVQIPGFGAHHSGVEIIGCEYSFSSNAGVFEVNPREADGCTFKEAIEVGETSLSNTEVTRVIDRLRYEWTGDLYDIIMRNCNHFADALCRALLNKRLPGWINRLATVGSFVRCCIPKSLRGGPQFDNAGSEPLLQGAMPPRQPTFTGQGHRLSDMQPSTAASWGLAMGGTQTSNKGDARELRLAAAMRRADNDGDELSHLQGERV
jgi:hypothetical protein